MKFALLTVVASLVATASAIRSLPQEREMTTMVREVLAMTGLHNEVIVVVDPDALGCAYARRWAVRSI